MTTCGANVPAAKFDSQALMIGPSAPSGTRSGICGGIRCHAGAIILLFLLLIALLAPVLAPRPQHQALTVATSASARIYSA